MKIEFPRNLQYKLINILLKSETFSINILNNYSILTNIFCKLFSVDDLQQLNVHSETVIYTQTFIKHDFSIKVFFV